MTITEALNSFVAAGTYSSDETVKQLADRARIHCGSNNSELSDQLEVLSWILVDAGVGELS